VSENDEDKKVDFYQFAKDEARRIAEAIAGADVSGLTEIETEPLHGGEQHVIHPGDGSETILIVVIRGRTIIDQPGMLGAIEPALIARPGNEDGHYTDYPGSVSAGSRR
jgi:hypothetical protein